MATLLGPWDVQYPVNFYENGDTVTQAFGKHIEEIVRIYGLLNALDAGKVTVEDFNAAMAAERQARIDADNAEAAARANADTAIWNKINNLNFGDIKGSLGLDRTTGNLGTDRINGLAEFIKQNGGVEHGTTAQGINYININGLYAEWGTVTLTTGESYSFKRSLPYPIIAFAYYPSPHYKEASYTPITETNGDQGNPDYEPASGSRIRIKSNTAGTKAIGFEHYGDSGITHTCKYIVMGLTSFN